MPAEERPEQNKEGVCPNLAVEGEKGFWEADDGARLSARPVRVMP